MRHLIEQHLEAVGRRRALLLTTLAIVWAAIGAAVVVWAVAKGILETVWATLAVRSADPVDIAVAIVLWTFLAVSVPLARAIVAVYRAWQDERWEANDVLTRLEERSGGTNSRHLASPIDRLALHGIEALESRLLGAPRDAGEAMQPRLVELGERAP